MLLNGDLENDQFLSFFMSRTNSRNDFISCTQPAPSRTIDEFMAVTYVYNHELRQCSPVDIQSARISVK